MEVPADEPRVIVEAVDAEGDALASVIIDQTAPAGETMVAAPIDDETTLEADVLVEIIAHGTNANETDAADIRTRVNAEMAAAVHATDDVGTRGHEVPALSLAVMAAEEAQVMTFARLGMETSGADEYAQARAEGAASAAFRATLSATIDANADAEVTFATDAVRATALLEAKAVADASASILRGAHATQALVDTTVDAGHHLVEKVSAGATLDEISSAYAAFSATVIGEAHASGGGSDANDSVLDALLHVDASSETTVDAAVATTVNAAASLDALVESAIDAAAETTDDIDVEVIAQAVVDAYASYEEAVESQGASLAAVGDAEASTKLLIVVGGAFGG